MREEVLETINESLKMLKREGIYDLVKKGDIDKMNLVNSRMQKAFIKVKNYFNPRNNFETHGLERNEINFNYLFELIYFILSVKYCESMQDKWLGDAYIFRNFRDFCAIIKKELGQLGCAICNYIDDDHDFCSIKQNEIIEMVQKYPIK